MRSTLEFGGGCVDGGSSDFRIHFLRLFLCMGCINIRIEYALFTHWALGWYL